MLNTLAIRDSTLATQISTKILIYTSCRWGLNLNKVDVVNAVVCGNAPFISKAFYCHCGLTFWVYNDIHEVNVLSLTANINTQYKCKYLTISYF